MSRLINAKINLSRIDKDKLFKGQKGIWLDLSIWINDTPDQYGNDISIQQRTKQGEEKIFLGSGKFYIKKEETPPVNEPVKAEILPEKSLPPVADEFDDLPF